MANIYKDDKHGYVCELWASSTKHPDSVFWFNDFKKTDLIPPEFQVYQWLLECASKLNFPMHAHKLVKQAEKYYIWDKNYYIVHAWFEDGDCENGPHCSDTVELILAKDKKEAEQLVHDGYYMEDWFTVAKREKDEWYIPDSRYEGYTVDEPLDYEKVKAWFEKLEELPF